MVVQEHVEGFEAFEKVLENHKNKTIFVLFSGSLAENGKTDPVINEAVKSSAPAESVFIHVSITRPIWKDKSNVFRTDERLKLKAVPTLMKWGQPQKLEEAQCANTELVTMLLEDD